MKQRKKRSPFWPGCRKKTAPGSGRFCGIAASKRLDNHQGCLRRFSLRSHQNRPLPGAAQSGSAKRPRPRWGLGPAGRSAKQSGRIFVAPAAHAPGFWMKKHKERPLKPWWLGGPLCVFYAPKSYGRTAVFLCHPGVWPGPFCVAGKTSAQWDKLPAILGTEGQKVGQAPVYVSAFVEKQTIC